MTKRLDDIVKVKQAEVLRLKQTIINHPGHPLAKILRGEMETRRNSRFKQALLADGLTVIAEVKRKSPSNGMLATIPHPTDLVKQYLAGGARAISVLTDQHFFSGSMNDLLSVAQVCHPQAIPVLRKDFILDKAQIVEAALAGADAVLLIMAVLGSKIKGLLKFAHALGLQALVEVINEAELNMALACGAKIIGINNRNLKTMEVDPECSLRLINQIPAAVVKVAASGIHTPAMARQYYQAGFDAVLIGEALVKAPHPETFIRACCDEKLSH